MLLAASSSPGHNLTRMVRAVPRTSCVYKQRRLSALGFYRAGVLIQLPLLSFLGDHLSRLSPSSLRLLG